MDELAENLQENLKIRQKLVNFCDLPMELVEKIAKEADLRGRLTLRKVSKPLRAIIDKLDPPEIYPRIGIKVNSDFMKLDLNGHLIFYRKTKENETIVGDSRRSKRIRKNIMDSVLDDLNSFISHPKVQIKHFKVVFTEENSYLIFSKRFRELLPSTRLSAQFVLIKGHEETILYEIMDWFDYNKMAQLEFMSLMIRKAVMLLMRRYYCEFKRTKNKDDRGFPIFQYNYSLEWTSRHTLKPDGRVYKMYSTICPGRIVEARESDRRKKEQQHKRKPNWNPYFSKHNALK